MTVAAFFYCPYQLAAATARLARNNEIAAEAGWDVLRFTTRDIEEEMPQTMRLVEAKIDRLGGVHDAREDVVRHVTRPNGRRGLFDLS